MSLDLESRLKRFFASAPQTMHPVQTLEISHSYMSKTYHLWREPYVGTTTVSSVVKTMQPANISIKMAGSPGHLDQKFDISIGLTDIGDGFRNQMDRIPINSSEKVRIIYREFLSDDLTSVQASTTLQVESVSYQIGAAVISAVSPRLNMTRTGELYTPKDIPMMRGFL